MFEGEPRRRRRVQRRVGHQDRRAGAAPAVDDETTSRAGTILTEAAMVFVEGSGSSRCSAVRATGRGSITRRVREINRPRQDAGPRTEPDVFVATPRSTVIAAAAPTVAVTRIAVVIIASLPERRLPSPPEPHRPTQAVQHVQRLAVNLQARRTFPASR